MRYDLLKRRVEHLTAGQTVELADQIIDATAGRGVFVRLTAAEAARKLRVIAAAKAANPIPQGEEP